MATRTAAKRRRAMSGLYADRRSEMRDVAYAQRLRRTPGGDCGRPLSARYARRRTWPGLILSGSVNWSLFNSKIFEYAAALPRCSLAIALSVSPAFTV